MIDSWEYDGRAELHIVFVNRRAGNLSTPWALEGGGVKTFNCPRPLSLGQPFKGSDELTLICSAVGREEKVVGIHVGNNFGVRKLL